MPKQRDEGASQSAAITADHGNNETGANGWNCWKANLGSKMVVSLNVEAHSIAPSIINFLHYSMTVAWAVLPFWKNPAVKVRVVPHVPCCFMAIHPSSIDKWLLI